MVVANNPVTPEPVGPPPPSMVQANGIWPTPKLLNLMLARWADDVTVQYELDPPQQDRVRSQLVNRWTDFLTEHRSEVQPLFNEFLEMRMELEPPDKDRVRAWAERAEPVFGLVQEQMQRTGSEVREILKPLQRVKFEMDALKFTAGMAFAGQQLKKWREGNFESDEFWEPTRAERRRRRAEKEGTDAAAKEQDQPIEVDAIGAELRAWDKYVEEFISHFELDEGQRTATISFLGEVKERAIAHRDRRKEDIAKLESRVRNHTGSPDDLEEIKRQLHELYGPVDQLFQELKGRMEAVPTEAQKASAAARGGEDRLNSPAQPLSGNDSPASKKPTKEKG